MKVTQRAYTLRLRGVHKPNETEDQAWRDALWRTHEAINKGAKLFGDWLLTLRGGLDHRLAEPPTESHRRIPLALSWLSVESADGAPKRYIIASGTEPESVRNTKVIDAFRTVLKDRGLKPDEIEAWVTDCHDSLCAAIRPDAVWVNRSEASRDRGLDSSTAQEALEAFFGDISDFLKLPALAKEKKFRQVARGWISCCWGTGEKSDPASITNKLNRLAEADLSGYLGRPGSELVAYLLKLLDASPGEDVLDALRQAVGWTTGRKSKGRLALEKAYEITSHTTDTIAALQEKLRAEASEKGGKGRKNQPVWAEVLREELEAACGMSFVCGRDLTSEFAVMLDHALRKVSTAHTWQMRAEARRQQLAKDASRTTPPDVEEFLDRLLEELGRITGASGAMKVSPRAVKGWEEIVKAWSGSDCGTAEDRITKVRELQSTLDSELGYTTLFEHLADDDAKHIWLRNGKPDPQPLDDYVHARYAQERIRRYKVPTYRHPDPFFHPIFCDYGCSRWHVSFSVHRAGQAVCKASKKLDRLSKEYNKTENEPKKNLENARAESQKSLSDHHLSLETWNGTTIAETELLWQSKRFAADLLLPQPQEGTEVSRGDRISRAAAGKGADAAVRVANIFDEDNWNSRLQVPRDQLERLGKRVIREGWDAQARKMLASLPWFVTVSARLLTQPEAPWHRYVRQHISNERPGRRPHSKENKHRKGLAELILCRLPHLRILSLDLGHRYAAACAVWETLPESEMGRICAEAGHRPPEPDDLALHIINKGNGRRTFYRRTGPEMWARLDRQFLIKLQGEDQPSRKASPKELADVREFENAVGRTRSEDDPLPTDITELMTEAINTARLALRRHGDRARIAFNLITDRKPMPGGAWKDLTPETRKELMLDSLETWQNLFHNPRWQDARAKELWEQHIHAELEPTPDPEAHRSELKEHSRKLRHSLAEHAARLANDPSLRKELHDKWAKYWQEEDRLWRTHLRWLRSWLLPRGASRSEGSIRRVGGLSIDRLANISLLRQILQAYRTRPEPDNTRKNVPGRGDTRLDKYGQRILDTLERLRENRVKQLASRIVEAALGIGSEDRSHWQGKKRPRQLIGNPRFAPCHAIVVENLENYRPEQTRARRENRRLMNWSAARVFKYLKEACELNDIHLQPVPSNYTSLQDSRTGAPGIRCTEMPVAKFLRWYRNRIPALREKKDALSRYIVELHDHLSLNPSRQTGTVLVPEKGGELFVSADPSSPAAKGLQADMNAAANIGLRALHDPDWPGRWWWVPCEVKNGKPAEKWCKGSAAIDLPKPLDPNLKQIEQDIVNLWRDVSADPIEPGNWQNYKQYWNGVTDRVIRQLRKHSGIG